MAWNAAIKAEWETHESKFTMAWYVSMFNLGKIRTVGDSSHDDIRDALEALPDRGVAAKMSKDVHLIEAALATDERIASLDDNARDHFSRLAVAVEKLQTVHWTNPAVEGEACLEWLEAGAALDANRLLSASL